MERKYCLVRAMGQSQEELEIFTKNNIVAVGWSEVNFTNYTDEEKLVSDVKNIYYSSGDIAPQVEGKKKNEVRRFKTLSSGDYIIVPHNSAICLAKVKEKQIYSEEDYDYDLANQREVSFHKDDNNQIVLISRDRLSEGLQRRIRVRGTTISDLSEFSQEIEDLFNGEDFNSQFNSKRESKIDEFKRQLISNIQSGKTNLQAGGYGLEKLVTELLGIEGYEARILSKQRFLSFSDADIEAVKTDFLVSKKLLIQVKHHSGISGTWGAEQLIEILNQEPDLFSEYTLVLVTSANPSKELEQVCENKGIILISGELLAEWIYGALPKLQYKTKKYYVLVIYLI